VRPPLVFVFFNIFSIQQGSCYPGDAWVCAAMKRYSVPNSRKEVPDLEYWSGANSGVVAGRAKSLSKYVYNMDVMTIFLHVWKFELCDEEGAGEGTPDSTKSGGNSNTWEGTKEGTHKFCSSAKKVERFLGYVNSSTDRGLYLTSAGEKLLQELDSDGKGDAWKPKQGADEAAELDWCGDQVLIFGKVCVY
jgi:hypothetical protein